MRTFNQIASELRGGAALDEWENKLRVIVEAVRATGKGGELTIKLSVKPAGRQTADTLVVTDVSKAMIPEHDRPETLFFATDGNDLSREDPKQMRFRGDCFDAQPPTISNIEEIK